MGLPLFRVSQPAVVQGHAHKVKQTNFRGELKPVNPRGKGGTVDTHQRKPLLNPLH